jgi:hypothetical protein
MRIPPERTTGTSRTMAEAVPVDAARMSPRDKADALAK